MDYVVTQRKPIEDCYKINTTTGCWEWNNALNHDGYGLISVSRGSKPARVRAHRHMYVLHKGEIPCGEIVRHKCDNPCCVNPDHLVLGSVQDNHRDMIDRGRSCHQKGTSVLPDTRGERHGSSKLREQDILLIRKRHSSGDSQTKLATHYRVSQQTISDIVTLRTWRHVRGYN